jgi:hypothetical protein
LDLCTLNGHRDVRMCVDGAARRFSLESRQVRLAGIGRLIFMAHVLL